MPSLRLASTATALALAGFFTTLTATAARAQDGRPRSPGGDAAAVASDSSDPAAAVLVARFVEARTTGEWARALAAYDELVERWPARAKDTRLTLDRATVLRKAGRRADAVAQLEGILEAEPENIVAIFQLAVMDLEPGDAPTAAKRREEAKELLLLAARNGLPVLRELQREKGAGFEAVLKDPRFILAALRASGEFDAGQALARGGNERVRDPFTLPAVGFLRDQLRPEKEEDGEQKRINAGLRAAAGARDLQREEDLRAEQLRNFVSRGNAFLVNMVAANREEHWAETLSQFERLTALADDMKHVDREEFQRSAAAFLIRGRTLRDEAAKRKKIAELDLVVTGIVVDGRPEGRSKSVIVFDDPDKRGRIYEAGDEIRDRLDRRIGGLKVVEIRDGSVRFKYDETEFVKELKPGSR